MPLVGVATQVLAQRLARAEHREQPHRGALVVGHLLEQAVAVVDGVGQRDEGAQRLVGIGAASDQRDDRGRDVTEGLEQGARPVGVEEPQAHQLALRDVTSGCHPANLPKPAATDQMTGSIRSRSKAETWPRYSSHSARLLRRKNS